MLTQQEKSLRFENFINSDKFGRSTYSSLRLFKSNVHYILHTLDLYQYMINKLDDKSFIPHDFTEKTVLIHKQYISLDIISRIISIIETVLILTDSLSRGYSSLPKDMTTYDTRQIRLIIEKIISKEYSLQQILGLPKIEELQLTTDEEKVLEVLYKNTINYTYGLFDELINFHDKFNIVYNKAKHGLTILAGNVPANTDLVNFQRSAVIAFDHKKDQDKMPKNFFITKSSADDFNNWFNVVSHITFNEKFQSEISSTILNLNKVCKYMINNHLNYAFNCGEGYLPWERENGKFHLSFFTDNNVILNENEKNILDSITNKIGKCMLILEPPFTMESEYKNDKVKKAFDEKQHVINIWMNPKE